MMRAEMNQGIGEYLTELMRAELSHFLGREPYERKEGEANHRNGSYGRRFTMKRFGEVAVGVREDGTRLVLGLQAGDKESAACWREFFKDLKSRGLSAETVTLGVMDGLAGLEMVFKEEFPKAEVQRFEVHVARNVLAKVPKKLKQAVADDMRSIFYASSKEKAKEFFVQFKEHWEKEVPSAVKCLENSLEPCLTFFKFPPEEWQALRTTNIIERLNKEFKRRTKSMEIVAGENACYRLLAFISLKMEVHWKRNPIGKVAYNLPIFQRVPLLDFTQNA
jgi:putative transposase